MLKLLIRWNLWVGSIKEKLQGKKGQGLVEYGLIIGLIAIIVVAIFLALGPQIKQLFSQAVSSAHVEQMQEQMAK